MKKEERSLAIFAPLNGFVVMLCFVLMLSGAAKPFVQCFAVDSENRIYVGVDSEIRVYEDGAWIHTFSPKTSHSYVFTINQDDTILLSTSTEVYVMDLEGNVLSVQDDPGSHTFNQLQYKKSKFYTENDTYRLVGELGWTRIVKNGTETVYRISLLSFAVKILLATCIISMVVFLLWPLKQQLKEKRLARSEEHGGLLSNVF